MMRVLRVAVVTLAVCVAIACGPSPAKSRPAQTSAASSPIPRNPCHAEGTNDSARLAAQGWCDEGVFTFVNVTSDPHNFLILLQFSKDGQMIWQGGDHTVFDEFHSIVDSLAVTTGLNVAFTLRDASGQMLGGCARKQGDSRSTCQ